MLLARGVSSLRGGSAEPECKSRAWKVRSVSSNSVNGEQGSAGFNNGEKSRKDTNKRLYLATISARFLAASSVSCPSCNARRHVPYSSCPARRCKHLCACNNRTAPRQLSIRTNKNQVMNAPLMNCSSPARAAWKAVLVLYLPA